jgi:hypothetical protein
VILYTGDHFKDEEDRNLSLFHIAIAKHLRLGNLQRTEI